MTLASGALVRRDSGEGGPALLNVLAAAVRTQDFALFVVGERKNLVEEFLAAAARRIRSGAWGISTVRKDNGKIVDPLIDRFNVGQVTSSAGWGHRFFLRCGSRILRAVQDVETRLITHYNGPLLP